MANIIASGDYWRLEDDGTLYIYCVGDMPNYTSSTSTIPWFNYRAKITSAAIADGVTSIGNYAFYYCSNLTSITIPSGVTNIGSDAFYACSNLTSITIPSGVTSIGDSAFRGCSSLTSITIPNSVTRIGMYAFYDCSGLKSITIPNGVTNIGQCTFEGCSALTSIAIPDSVTRIEQYAFSNCNALTDVYYGGTETQWNAITKGGSNTRLTSATIHYNYTPPAPTYTVTFDANGGTGNMSAQTFTAGTAQTLTANAFTRMGYRFGGWNTAADGSGTAYADGASYTANADTTLYAQWTANLSSIAVTTPPAKTAYTAGETFDPSGMVVAATYSDASTAAVSDYSVSPSGNLATSDSSATVSYTENDVTKTAIVAITVTAQEPEMPPSMSWPRTALNVMKEIAARIGTPLDPRTVATLSAEDVEDTALKMTMKEVAGYIAAMNAGNWTITDEGNLYLVLLGAAQQAEADISAHNAESLSVSDPLEAWSGVRVIWDGEEWDASGSSEDGEIPVKSGDQIGFAGDESGRVLEIKVAFGQYAHPNPAHLWDRGAERILSSIRNNAYFPFEAQNVILDPACGIGDAVTVPGGTSLICSMSGELDGLCAVDASAPPDEAINTAYPANWQAASSGERVTGLEVEQIVTDAWNAASDG